jgi:hypothetical protein
MTQLYSLICGNAVRCIAVSFVIFIFVNAGHLYAQNSPSLKTVKTVGIGGDFLKIADALDSVNAGGFTSGLVLTLLDSSYNESPLEINRVLPIPYFIIKPATGKKPVVHIASSSFADSVGFLIAQITSVILNDITFSLQQNSFLQKVIKITTAPGDITLEKISIRGNNVPWGIVVSPHSDDSVSLNMHNCSLADIGGGISINGFTSFTLKNSSLLHNANTAIELFSEGGNIEIKNNMCRGNGIAQGGIVGDLMTARCTIDSNSFIEYENFGISLSNIFYPARKNQNAEDSFGTMSICNNTISYMIGGGGIIIDTAEYIAFDIRGNTIASQFGSPRGIFIGKNLSCPFVTIHNNSISSVANGMEFGEMELTLDGDTPNSLIIDSNVVLCSKNGIKFNDWVFANIEIEKNNLSNTGTLPTMSQAQDKKIITYGICFNTTEGILHVNNNTIHNFFCGIYLPDFTGVSLAHINTNTISNANIGIASDNELYCNEFKISGNSISGRLEGSGINIVSIYAESNPSTVDISDNSIIGTNNAVIGYAGIFIEEINAKDCQINNNIIYAKVNSGMVIGYFEGNNDEKIHPMKHNKRINSKVKIPRTNLGEDFIAQFSISNNTITHHASFDDGEGAIILGDIELCNVTVSRNTTTSDGFSVNGIKFDELYVGNFSMDSNAVSQTEIGIGNEYAFFHKKVSISYNTIYSTTIGLSQSWSGGKYASIRGNVAEPYLNNPNYYPEVGIGIGVEADSGIIENNVAHNFEAGFRIYSRTNFTSINANIATHNEIGMIIWLFSDNIVSNNVAMLSNFENNTISDNSNIGLRIDEIDYNLPLLVRYNRFFRNADCGIFIQDINNAQPIIHSNSFGENGLFEIRNETGREIIAEHNWWGTTTTAEMDATPYPGNITTLYDVFDDSIRGFIRYNHWLHDTNYVPIGSIIQGRVFHDTNADSIFYNEVGVNNRKIFLTGTHSDSATTSNDGLYFFYDVPPGEYIISLPPDSLWFLSYPATQHYQLTLDTAEFALRNDFGIFTYGSIEGYVFQDYNSNGIRDNNEPFLGDQWIYLGGLQQDSLLTDMYGSFVFRNLFPGNYFVCPIMETAITTSDDTLFTQLHSQELIYGLGFGIFEYSSVSGIFFNDRDSNGIRSTNEEGLANWRVIIFNDTWKDTVYSDSSGFYSFDSLRHPQYRVAGELKQSWRRTVPVLGYYTINISPGVSTENKDFGMFQRSAGISENDKPLEFSLVQNYPNPFNPATKIEYSLAQQTFVTLKIYTILGEEIATLVHNEQPAGKYAIEWNARDVASGLYFYRMQAGNFLATRKLIIQK